MAWSYTRQIKTELAKVPAGALPCHWAELWGLSGRLAPPQPGRPWIQTGAALVARRAHYLLKTLNAYGGLTIAPTGHRLRFMLTLGDVPPPDWDGFWPECALAFLRGAFLARGYVAGLDRPAHWEITTVDSGLADAAEEALAGLDVAVRRTVRRQFEVVYLKNRPDIALVLGMLGAHQAVLDWESHDVVRQMKNQVNRLVNFETANLQRAINAGVADRALLSAWLASHTFQELPPALAVLAELRWRHPDWPLNELGRHLLPPLSKSAVNHRLRRLRNWLTRYLEKQEG